MVVLVVDFSWIKLDNLTESLEEYFIHGLNNTLLSNNETFYDFKIIKNYADHLLHDLSLQPQSYSEILTARTANAAQSPFPNQPTSFDIRIDCIFIKNYQSQYKFLEINF
jgi:hypothetical protein